MAWLLLRDSIYKGKIKLNKKVDWVEYFNQQPKNESINPEYLSAFVGLGKDSVLQKFQNDIKTRLDYNLQINDFKQKSGIYALSFMQKNLEFYYPMMDARCSKPLAFNHMDTVQFFGHKVWTYKPEYQNHLIIYDYHDEDDFILQVKNRIETEYKEINDMEKKGELEEVSAIEGDEEIYFAKVAPQKTLLETYKNVINRIAQNEREYLKEGDEIRLPFIKFKQNHHFLDIKNAKILNLGVQDNFINTAKQIIDFELNQERISLQSLGMVDAVFGMPQQKHRQFIFDKPFLIILKEKQARQPYFLMWVANTEFMRKR